MRPRGLGRAFDHLALAVDGWLLDVGFGRHSVYPLGRRHRGDQPDPRRPVPRGDAARWRYRRLCEIDLGIARTEPAAPCSTSEPTCWWQQTSPESHFRAGPVASRLTDTFGLLTLADRTLTATEATGRVQTVLESDDDVLEAYRSHFQIGLDRLPPVP